MHSTVERQSAAFGGIRRLLAYFHMDFKGFPPQVQTLEEAVEVLNEETGLILVPAELEGDWYRTAAGPLLVRDQEGMAQAVLPDWWGRCYFLDEGTGRRVYLNGNNCGRFDAMAYAVYRDFPEHKISPAALMGRLLRGLSQYEALLLVVWALLGAGLWVLLAQMVYSALSNAVLAADQAAFWRIAAAMGGLFLLEVLLLFSGGQVVRRASQKGALQALMGVGARLYAAGRPDNAGEEAFRLAGFRDRAEQWVSWMLTTAWGFAAAVVLAAALAGNSPTGFVMAGVIALALYAGSMVRCRRAAERPPEPCGDAARREWFLRRAVDRRLGVERPFPAGNEARQEAPMWIGWAAEMVLVLPLIYFAVESGLSLARLAQALLLYLPVTALPLCALLSAGRAGRGLSELLALLPSAVKQPKGEVDLPPMGSIFELKDVSFAYPDRETPVLQGANLRVHPGEIVGILGKTGAGKTTLARLMTGILQPTGGNIYYGGVELARYNGASLRRRIAGQNGADILLTDRVPEQRSSRACVVFSTRQEALTGCDRVFFLSGGVLNEWKQE